MSDQNTTLRQKLKEMAQLSVLSNRMSEIQEKNLRAYPFVFFNDVKSVKIDYDISKVDDDGKINHYDHHVTFYLELEEKGKETNVSLDKRLYCLAEATRVLFWNDLKIKIFINDKLAYESEKNG